MTSLKVPESGLHLQAGKDASLPAQAFVISLDENTIQGLIKCARNDGDIEISMGSSPALHYGSKTHRIPPPRGSHPLDLYLTKPFESTRHAERLPYTSSLFKRPSAAARAQAEEAKQSRRKTGASSKSSNSSGIDSDLEALKDGLAAHDAARERAHVVDKLPATKKAKGKLLSGYSSTPRSMPTSPALNGRASPANTSTLTSSQQLMERHREQRSPLVHELASRDQSEDYLAGIWPGNSEDFKQHLEKCGEYMPDTDKWALKTMYWKELKPWDYDYETQEDRQSAIDNAIRKYDKQRLGPSEPEWQRLLPKEERGKGKCLSKLQARLDAASAPKIKVQGTDDSSSSRDDGDVEKDRSRHGGEAMSRSSSNPLPSKAKKSSVESQFKKVINSKARSAVQKPSPTKPARSGAGATKNSGRVLSQAIITNSDSSDDEAPPLKPEPVRSAPKAKDTVVARPLAREPPKPQSVTKRRREEEEDESSSSSGTPLAHRLPLNKMRPIKQVKPRPKEPPAPFREKPASTYPSKNKNTSPIKSSPLASSPPTNASEFEDDRPPIKKRKAEIAGDKRSVVRAVPSGVMSKAQKFKMYYQRYEALHYQISALDHPPRQKLEDLMDMRERLENMKKDIYRQYASDRD